MAEQVTPGGVGGEAGRSSLNQSPISNPGLNGGMGCYFQLGDDRGRQ